MKLHNLLTLVATGFLIASASASVTIDWVTVGNAGNAADIYGYGAVGYNYRIGKYEVTNAQYGEFLNATAATDSYGLYNTGMESYGITRTGSSGSYTYSVTGALANHPVAHISWYDAARFANWLANGQGNGSTETGSYTLNGKTSGTVFVNPGAQIYIPTENEWYKAAYYNPATATYSLYPNGQSAMTSAEANSGNIIGFTTNVGSYAANPSAYGTFDQGGNVWEWNDTVSFGWARGKRGGSWFNHDDYLASVSRLDSDPSNGNYISGFRLASVPEPRALILTTLASGAMLLRRRRK